MARELKRVCVFCGASAGRGDGYARAARELGRALAVQGIGVVYGGGRVGLMGAVADGALEGGGSVFGVITRLLKDKELGHDGITELVIAETMHERKARMAEMSDAFVALPGGLGTLDELFEILAWAQLGIHSKPVGLLNTAGYYDALMTFLDHVENESFLRLNHRTDVHVDGQAARLIDKLRHSTPTRGVFPGQHAT